MHVQTSQAWSAYSVNFVFSANIQTINIPQKTRKPASTMKAQVLHFIIKVI